MKKIVCITSGGMDSTVLLHYHVRGGDEVRALAIDYGQRHRVELQFARWQAESLNIPFEIVDLSSLAAVLPGSSQTSSSVPVPEGHYTAANMKATVVPNRNMILLAVAIGHAVAYKMDAVSYAAHSGDHAIYPDCRPEFADAMEKVAALCDYRPIAMLRPFIRMTKGDIVRLGHEELQVNFAETHSCYSGNPEQHCGKCGTCVERILAFREVGVADPTRYADTTFALEADAEFRRAQGIA